MQSHDTAWTRREGEPFLLLSELSIDDLANVDFSTLTDLRTLRALALRHPQGSDLQYYVAPICAESFFPATSLRRLSVHILDEGVKALVDHLWSV